MYLIRPLLEGSVRDNVWRRVAVVIEAATVASGRVVPCVPPLREAVEDLFIAASVGGKTGAVEPECGGGCVVAVVAAVVAGASNIPTVPVAAASAIVRAAVAVAVVGSPSVVVIVAAI